MSFFTELRRRNVIRMAGLYLVGAWLIVQVAETVLPAFDVPGWVLRALIILLAIGFLPSLLFSWVFELTPEGLKRESEIDRSRSIVDHTARKLDIAVIVLLLAVGALLGWNVLVRPDAASRQGVSSRDGAQLASTEGASAPPSSPDGSGTIAAAHDVDSAPTSPPAMAENTKSIAVLPFTDLSPEGDQEYFSDGISEEILNALAKVRDLKVAGRTSSFAFKGRNEDLRAIGKTLGVANILEGSVRKQGERVRITAQLIQVDDGFHLWSETYDGDLSDIFELQENIARAITDNLKVILQGDQKQRLVPVATDNAEAYGLYLQASAVFNRREGSRFAEAIGMLDQALRLDPKFARAHARMGALQILAPQYAGADLDRSIADASEHAAQAIALDPGLAEAYAVKAQCESSVRNFIGEHAAYQKALSADPDDVLSNFWLGSSLVAWGYLKQGDERLDRVLSIDPLLPNALMWRGARHVFAGELEQGEVLLRRADSFGISNVGLGLAHLAEERSERDAAVNEMARGLQVFMSAFPPDAARIVAEGSFGTDAQRAAAVHMVEDYLAGDHAFIAGAAPYALIRLGEPARALEVMARAPTDADPLVYFLLWSPAGRQARRLPGFGRFADEVGLTRLWDALGAPDLCRKQGDGGYVCE